jgi:ubiquinone/menaquinone biosynthesis C-methylase UbiE
MGYSREELESIPSESVMGLGCGEPVSVTGIEAGDIVIDLGSGGGIDAFLTSARAGPEGRVIGIDFTEEMVNKALVTAAHYG